MSEVRERGGRLREEARMAHLAAVVDTSSDAILSKTLDGTITSWNASAERIFGYGAEEIVGRTSGVLIPDELQAEEDEILAQLRPGSSIEHYETVRLTKDGRRLDVSLSISPIKDAPARSSGRRRSPATSRRGSGPRSARWPRPRSSSRCSTSRGSSRGSWTSTATCVEVNDLALDACGYMREEVLDRPFWETPWWRGSERGAGADPRGDGAGRRGRGLSRDAVVLARRRQRARRRLRDASDPRRVGARAVPPPDGGRHHRARSRPRRLCGPREAEEREIAVGLQRALLPASLVARRAGCHSQPGTTPAATCSRSAVTGTTPSRSQTAGSR